MPGKVLYVYNLRVSFIRKDIAYLREHFQVDEFPVDTRGSWQLILNLIRQCFTLLFNMSRYDVVVIFFAGYHSVLPVMLSRFFRKPVLLILGGADCYAFPSIDYGNYRKFALGKATAFSIRHATHLSAVHEALVYSSYSYDDHDGPYQGYQEFVGRVDVPETTIYLEYDPFLFPFREQTPERLSFITVGFGMDGNTFKRKGADLILDLARRMPEARFTIVGSDQPASHLDIPPNMHLLPPVPYENLAALYQEHQFYLQLSMAEGFPSAICEAMLCGCIPIGSNVAAIPYIIGETGFVLEKKDKALLYSLVLRAVHAPDLNERGMLARKRILEICAPGTRSGPLTKLVQSLID